MTELDYLCPTCLSTLEDGAEISQSMYDFLREVLHFKYQFEEKSLKLVCLKCYRTLIEFKRFYAQLRDIELYFESKSKIEQISIEDGLVEELDELEEAFTAEIKSSVDITEQMRQDRILIEPTSMITMEHEVIVNRESYGIPTDLDEKVKEERFVGLVCSKSFNTVHDIRSHETTHKTTSNQSNALPKFLNTSPKKRKKVCPECNCRFDQLKDLRAHQRKHELERRKPFRCFKCSRGFLTSDAVRDHELVHMQVETSQCEICLKKYLNRPSLEAHMRIAHSSSPDKAT